MNPKLYSPVLIEKIKALLSENWGITYTFEDEMIFEVGKRKLRIHYAVLTVAMNSRSGKFHRLFSPSRLTNICIYVSVTIVHISTEDGRRWLRRETHALIV